MACRFGPTKNVCALHGPHLDAAGTLSAGTRDFRQVAADQASEQRRTFDLAQVVKEILQTLSPSLKRHAHRVTLDIAEGIAMDSQPGPLGQIIINLVNNAYLHAFEGMEQGELLLHAHSEGDWVQLGCATTGWEFRPST